MSIYTATQAVNPLPGGAMLQVRFKKSDIATSHIDAIAASFAKFYPRSPAPPKPARHVAPETLGLRITAQPRSAPFTISRAHGVTVSLWQSEGICQYAEISESTYAALCCLLGMAQWRALQANPLLKDEDLFHPSPSDCLFSTPDTFQEYALLLEEPTICPGCRDFYHCLGADMELVALRAVLRAIGRQRRPLTALG